MSPEFFVILGSITCRTPATLSLLSRSLDQSTIRWDLPAACFSAVLIVYRARTGKRIETNHRATEEINLTTEMVYYQTMNVERASTGREGWNFLQVPIHVSNIVPLFRLRVHIYIMRVNFQSQSPRVLSDEFLYFFFVLVELIRPSRIPQRRGL